MLFAQFLEEYQREELAPRLALALTETSIVDGEHHVTGPRKEPALVMVSVTLKNTLSAKCA